MDGYGGNGLGAAEGLVRRICQSYPPAGPGGPWRGWVILSNPDVGTAVADGRRHGHVDGLCGPAPRAGGVASRHKPGM